MTATEIWDDDFEFNPNSPPRKRKNKVDGGIDDDVLEPSRVSHASSRFTADWDADAVVGEPGRESPHKGGVTKVFSAPSLSAWAEPGPSTPSRRPVPKVTENWDDDFEDKNDTPVRRPRRDIYNNSNNPSPAKEITRNYRSLQPLFSNEHTDQKASVASRNRASSSVSAQGPRARYLSSGGDLARNHASPLSDGDEEDDEFGFADKDDDRTVTARSRHPGFTRLNSLTNHPLNDLPPPPVPSIPPSLLPQPRVNTLNLDAVIIGTSQPFPRSPASSVFSLPTTVATESIYYGSTTHLHPTSSRTSSSGGGFSRLPPSPPIHKERERRRLRKKSRPPPQGVFELLPVASEDHLPHSLPHDERSHSPARSNNSHHGSAHSRPRTPQTPGSTNSFSTTFPNVNSTPSATRHSDTKQATPSTPSSSSKGGALLSRIGSVKKWGVRRKRGISTTQKENATTTSPGGLDLTTENTHANLPRPTSSLSSLAASTTSSRPSSSSRPASPSAQAPKSTTNNTNTSPGWFFRNSEAHSHASHTTTTSPVGRGGGPEPGTGARASASATDLSLPLPGRGRPPDGGEQPDEKGAGKANEKRAGSSGTRTQWRARERTPSRTGSRDASVARVMQVGEKSRGEGILDTPTKLLKRKSLGFVQLGRALSSQSSGTGADGVGGIGMSVSTSSPGQPRHASYGGTPSLGRSSLVPNKPRKEGFERLFAQQSEKSENGHANEFGNGDVDGSGSGRGRRKSLSVSATNGGSIGSGKGKGKLRQKSRDVSMGEGVRGTQVQEGSRGFLGSVRKMSLVGGKHKKQKSLGAVIGAMQAASQDRRVSDGVVVMHARDEAVVPDGHPVSSTSKRDEVVGIRAEGINKDSPAGEAKPHLLPPLELPNPTLMTPTTTSHVMFSQDLPVVDQTGAARVAEISGSIMLSSELDDPPASPPPPLSPPKPTTPKKKIPTSPTRGPSSPQSASLGRSTYSPTRDTGSSPSGALERVPPRRNSLGDLKIPARISQAQVGLRRDLGMVREFASNVEQLRVLQATYHDLVVEIQQILDSHAYLHAQQQQQAAAAAARSVSPSFFSRPKGRRRSNTNPGPGPEQQFAYKQLASSFYTINSKYRITWECAELLIELGGGSSAAPPTSVSAPLMIQERDNGVTPRKGRERAITLAGDESKVSSGAITGAKGDLDMEAVGGSGAGSGAASLSRRASSAAGGRNELNQRQMILLKELLNSADSSFIHHDDTKPGMLEEQPRCASSHSHTQGHSPNHTNANKDWRWGDPTNSTVTLPPSEDSAGSHSVFGSSAAAAGSGTGMKKRGSKLGMAGLRDLLRMLKRHHTAHPAHPTPRPTSFVPPHPPVAPSTTSLSSATNSSTDVHSRYLLPLDQNVIGDGRGGAGVSGRRRAKTSSGPESLGASSSTSSMFPSMYDSTPLPSRPSRGRPSLAAIFRIPRPLKLNKPSGSQSAQESCNEEAEGRTREGRAAAGTPGSAEDDWDRIETPAELENAVKALGVRVNGDGTATVRGKGRSPYLQHPPQIPTLFTGGREGGGSVSPSLGLGPSPAGLFVSPRRTASSSQTSLYEDSPTSSSHNVRPTRLSNVDENDVGEEGGGRCGEEGRERDGRLGSVGRYFGQRQRSTSRGRVADASTAPVTPPPRSSSRTYSNNNNNHQLSSKSSKNGSVRSMPPQPVPELRLAMTPENIRPLNENAKEVHARLVECIAEIQALLDSHRSVVAAPLAENSAAAS
ncbi:hypothetical protein AMATHDRAFT_51142 [Amanita thiersii Skay4041]|uniref:Uncharacterized protein n=1 Tax=Amanita thiersii Skay4041 TaxID=703135 RepID=A0A2A9N8T4_9AGAR|nr:hypothetical protein AMATHDRAFT_51142 [Amanita thiersii Skay4041]